MNTFCICLKSFHSIMDIPSTADLLSFMSLVFCHFLRPISLCPSTEKTEIGWSILPFDRSGLSNTKQVMRSHALCFCLMHLTGVDVTSVQHCQLNHLLIHLKLDSG